MSNSNTDNINYGLLKGFIDFDLSSQNHQETEVSDADYINLLRAISAETQKNIKRSNRKPKRSEDIIFDGNVPLDGFSTNEKIAKLQKDANVIMKKLSNEHNLPPIGDVALNSAFSNALSVPDQEEIYYQKIYRKNDDKIVTAKLANIFIYPSRILTLLKDAYLVGNTLVENDLFLFCWTFLDFIKNLKSATEIELSYSEVIVLIYIQKYAVPFISETDLKKHIENNHLSFNISKDMNSYTISKEEISKIVEKLEHLEIISLDDGNIRLIETILL